MPMPADGDLSHFQEPSRSDLEINSAIAKLASKI